MANGRWQAFFWKGEDMLDSRKYHSAGVYPINIGEGGKDGK
jgi:hypothetical protein